MYACGWEGGEGGRELNAGAFLFQQEVRFFQFTKGEQG